MGSGFSYVVAAEDAYTSGRNLARDYAVDDKSVSSMPQCIISRRYLVSRYIDKNQG